ncbi:MAG: type IV secretion system DNA-binding domain-containing protein [Candidatus Berkelbacteria bacterium]|nr:type IV secretion system DNA-binding domain-containing protein [Candidatus Berkelbacteria bacterium]
MLDQLPILLIKGLGYLIMIGIPIIIIAIFYKKGIEQKKIDWFSKIRFIVLKIQVPKLNEKTPLAAEQMFAALHGIFKAGETYQEYISFEIAAKDKYLQFYVSCPTHLKDFIQSQVYAQYPTAEIFEVDDYALEDIERIRSGNLKIAGVDLNLTNNDVYPLKTFLNFEVDPLAAITGVMSKVEKDEQIWIQMLVKPISDDWQTKSIGHIQSTKSGGGKTNVFGEVSSAITHAITGIITTILTGATPPSTIGSEGDKKEITLSGTAEAGLKGVETKATKLGFGSKIRIVALAPNENVAHAKIASVVGAFKQFNLLNMNGFQASQIKNDFSFFSQYQRRWFVDEGYILNIEELASIYHLPSISVQTPNIVWAGSKKGEPPADLPIEENVEESDLTIFAKADFRHLQHKFGIKIPDRRYHMYAIGKTGTGKSTMLENMAIDDIREGRGLAVVDPHGDLINHVMDYIPEERIKDVVIFSPADKMFPVAFNPLENVDPDMKNIVASGVVGIFKKIFGESWGPRLEYILRNTILALLDYPNATMLGITKILVDKQFRDKVVSNITDPVIKDFFVNEFEQYDPKFRTEAISPIQNKVGQFLSSSTIRNIVGQPKSTINLKEIMDTGKIFLVNLSIGEIGEDASSLLGSLMITKIQLAAMQRSTIPEEERKDFYLYVDEFQNFATDSFAVILSEARKYHLNLIMTNQYIAQMPETVRDAVFGNVGTLISYRVGAPDAAALKQEFAPIFEEVDLVNLDNYHIYVKMSIDGVTCPAFSAVTLPRDAKKFENKEKIINFSREHYSRQREYVEKQLEQIANLPKVEEILTKAEKKLIPKLPPKIGDTYYREIQNPGDVRWYFGGGTKDLPLTEETVQEKVQKTEEKAEEFAIKRAVEKEEVAQWQKERLDALKVDKPSEHFATQLPDNSVQKDKEELSKSINMGSNTKVLNEGETVKID